MEQKEIRQHDSRTHFTVPHTFLRNWAAILRQCELLVMLHIMQALHVSNQSSTLITMSKLSVSTGCRVLAISKAVNALHDFGILGIEKIEKKAGWAKYAYSINWDAIDQGLPVLGDPITAEDQKTTTERRAIAIEYTKKISKPGTPTIKF